MSPNDAETGATTRRFPRVSGDEPPIAPGPPHRAGFSPRERG